jgi:cold shock protein
LIGTLRLSNAFSRFGFIVPRGGGAEAYVHLGQLRRSGVKHPKDGLSLRFEPTAAADGRSGVRNVRAAK